jgi:hypothetical protein
LVNVQQKEQQQQQPLFFAKDSNKRDSAFLFAGKETKKKVP